MLCFDRRAPAYASPFWRVLDFDAAIRSWKPRQNNDEKCICRAKMTKSRHPCDRICFQRLSVCKNLAALCVTSSPKGTYPLGQPPNQVPSNGLKIATRVVIGCEGNVKSGRFACFFQGFIDNHDIIHTHHAWPSQVYSKLLNLLISLVKTLVIASGLSLLLDKFSYICEGRSWWVRIIYNFSGNVYVSGNSFYRRMIVCSTDLWLELHSLKHDIMHYCRIVFKCQYHVMYIIY